MVGISRLCWCRDELEALRAIKGICFQHGPREGWRESVNDLTPGLSAQTPCMKHDTASSVLAAIARWISGVTYRRRMPRSSRVFLIGLLVDGRVQCDCAEAHEVEY